MRYFSDIERATIITNRVRDWKILEIVAQEYTCPFAAISNSISTYNQIGQREFPYQVKNGKRTIKMYMAHKCTILTIL